MRRWSFICCSAHGLCGCCHPKSRNRSLKARMNWPSWLRTFIFWRIRRVKIRAYRFEKKKEMLTRKKVTGLALMSTNGAGRTQAGVEKWFESLRGESATYGRCVTTAQNRVEQECGLRDTNRIWSGIIIRASRYQGRRYLVTLYGHGGTNTVYR